MKYLQVMQQLVTKVFDFGEKEGYENRIYDRDLESNGNWVWGADERGTIVLRHRGEDCPEEVLSELMLHLISVADGLPTAEAPVLAAPETPLINPAHPFLR